MNMKLLKSFLAIKKNEIVLVLNMFLQFFCIITTFWIFKPLKKSLFLKYYDKTPFHLLGLEFNAPQAELLAKVLNLVGAIIGLAVFSYLSKSFKREKLSYIFTAIMMAFITYFGFSLDSPTSFDVWSFYVFGDMYNTILLVTFFAFLNDIVTSEQAKRLYGPILLGGVLGGVVATSYVTYFLDRLSLSQWMIPSLIITSFVALTSYFTGTQVPKESPKANIAGVQQNTKLTEYFRSIMKQKYLLGIMAMVGLYEMISTIMDFQFSSVVSYYLDGSSIGAHISLVFTIVNWSSLIVQIFLTSFVLTNIGTGSALAILPISVLGASSVYIIFPFLWVASLLPIFDNALKYSIYQSAYETLYVPLDQNQIYQAKSVIDIFIVRWAKVLAIGLSLLISMLFTSFQSIRWISLLSVLLITCWLLVIRFVVNEFKIKNHS